jgi:hypothetical protein
MDIDVSNDPKAGDKDEELRLHKLGLEAEAERLRNA